MKLAAESAWLARQIADYPLLLDELLDTRLFDVPPTREELAALFEQTLHAAHPNDSEATLEAIRVFQRTATFRIAIADRLGSLPLMKVSDRLTDTAELVLEFALQTAWRELVAKFGQPMRGDAAQPREAGFAVIGYGKLGGLELVLQLRSRLGVPARLLAARSRRRRERRRSRTSGSSRGWCSG